MSSVLPDGKVNKRSRRIKTDWVSRSQGQVEEKRNGVGVDYKWGTFSSLTGKKGKFNSALRGKKGYFDVVTIGSNSADVHFICTLQSGTFLEVEKPGKKWKRHFVMIVISRARRPPDCFALWDADSANDVLRASTSSLPGWDWVLNLQRHEKAISRNGFGDYKLESPPLFPAFSANYSDFAFYSSRMTDRTT